jgi:hypothetical protein
MARPPRRRRRRRVRRLTGEARDAMLQRSGFKTDLVG